MNSPHYKILHDHCNTLIQSLVDCREELTQVKTVYADAVTKRRDLEEPYTVNLLLPFSRQPSDKCLAARRDERDSGTKDHVGETRSGLGSASRAT